jgi:PTS system mannose-specific IIB component/fructoselysine and glucoselysine-specific PTS system IIB component
MSLALIRLDDRLIHGQVVIGWGQPLNVGFIVLVDDEVKNSAWEQDLYRMGVPPGIDVVFASVADVARHVAEWAADPRPGILLVGDVDTLAGLIAAAGPGIHTINVGGVHHRPGRTERLRYVYLTDDEAAKLKQLATNGVEVTAQDVPTARAVPIGEFL